MGNGGESFDAMLKRVQAKRASTALGSAPPAFTPRSASSKDKLGRVAPAQKALMRTGRSMGGSR